MVLARWNMRSDAGAVKEDYDDYGCRSSGIATSEPRSFGSRLIGNSGLGPAPGIQDGCHDRTEEGAKTRQ
jgi:hypothetical protein